jgi:aminoglycoside/choline kinase family phosphotransferase
MKSVFKEERSKVGLEEFDSVDFDREFDLQTVQRCLKAAGTFSFQSAVREKAYFIPFIDPMFQIVHATLSRIDRFPTLRKVLEAEFAAND